MNRLRLTAEQDAILIHLSEMSRFRNPHKVTTVVATTFGAFKGQARPSYMMVENLLEGLARDGLVVRGVVVSGWEDAPIRYFVPTEEGQRRVDLLARKRS